MYDVGQTGPDLPEVRKLPAVRHRRFHTIDPDAAQRFFSKAYAPSLQISGLTHGAAVTHRRWEAGLITIDEMRIEGQLSCELQTDDSVLAIQPEAGSLVVGEKPVTEVMVATDDMPCVLGASNACFRLVSISPELLRNVAAHNNMPLPQKIRFLNRHPLAGGTVKIWNDALDYVSATYASVDTANRPLVVAAAAQVLTAALLECFPSNLAAAQDRTGKTPASPALKRAMAFIEQYASHGISVNDIAAATNQAPRTIQYLFRQQLDTTPTEYLRRVRLQRAHADLVCGDQSCTTVAEIAQRWGFAHPGRFASLYRQTYGHTPNMTLRR